MAAPEQRAAASPADEDQALMRRVQADDENALGQLMERWELPTKAVIARLVFNASEAEELAQETLVRVWQQREKYRPEAAFRPWLFAIAINLARNRLRWWRRRPTISLDEWTEAGAAADTQAAGAGNHPPAAAAGTAGVGADRLVQLERHGAVQKAIAGLPADLREAIVLFQYEEMSHAEIATAVGASPKAVETRIYRAKEKLRAALAREWES